MKTGNLFGFIMVVALSTITATTLFTENQNTQTKKQQINKLNVLDKNGYAPIHNLIFEMETQRDISEYVNAIKNAKPEWNYKHGESMVGKNGDNLDPYIISWKADTSKEEVLAQLMKAVEEVKTEQVALVKKLLEAGALVDFPDSFGRTALWWAAERNLPAVIECLIEAGADVNKKTQQGYSPLHVAACDGNKESVECLLKYKADPNITDNTDATPLHDAGRGECWIYPSMAPEHQVCHQEKLQDYKDIIDLLIQHGASTNIKNKEGLTPAELARKQQDLFYPKNDTTPKIVSYPLAEEIESYSVKKVQKQDITNQSAKEQKK